MRCRTSAASVPRLYTDRVHRARRCCECRAANVSRRDGRSITSQLQSMPATTRTTAAIQETATRSAHDVQAAAPTISHPAHWPTSCDDLQTLVGRHTAGRRRMRTSQSQQQQQQLPRLWRLLLSPPLQLLLLLLPWVASRGVRSVYIPIFFSFRSAAWCS